LIPTTVAGVAVFLASLSPGYIWVRVAEVRVPRQRRTQLLEAAELVLLGGVFSVISVAAVYIFSVESGLIDPM
jgi:hypothetical protein